ncbi:MAG TPA: hypothetical protein VGM98_08365 [Schlesneria sp.]|jgi:hypothetical protein
MLDSLPLLPGGFTAEAEARFGVICGSRWPRWTLPERAASSGRAAARLSKYLLMPCRVSAGRTPVSR